MFKTSARQNRVKFNPAFGMKGPEAEVDVAGFRV
jgi:hypothetical protein